MVGRENKGGAVFSWADEVEKEEEEEEAAAAATGQQRQKKPNPFGSARPREVVLQDKGIDWRQLDLHLQQPSPSPNGFHQNEKLQKQSSPQLVTGSPHPQVTLSPRIRSPILCAPPLRYPPKYVAGLLYEHWVSTAPNASRYQHVKIEKGKHESTVGRRARSEFVEAKEAQQGQILEGKENFHGIGTPEMPLSATGIVRQPTNIQVDSSMDENDGAMEHKWQKVNKKTPRFLHKASKQWCSSKEEF
ncbi:hypothetical protein V6N13_140289 [Hibiscus sabdariffa]|uniref:Uncharacterized protein n=1 Tax=Hibiscus sabdariffa TaxID=183260 RepID=A0ABR2QAX9_9ROSI